MIVVGGLAIDRQRRVFMARRPVGKPRPLMWEFPGGKLERGDSAPGDRGRDQALRRALVRELEEELGHRVKVLSHVAEVKLEVEVAIEWHLYHVHLFHPPQLLAHDNAGWFHLDDAIVNLPCTPTTYLAYRAASSFAQEIDVNSIEGIRPW